MSKLIVYNLEKYLPVYDFRQNSITFSEEVVIVTHDKSNKNEINQAIINTMIENLEQEELCPEWVNTNIKIGDFGERIVEEYLKKDFDKVKRVSLTNSSLGYDLQVTDSDGSFKAFEVKTSLREKNNFQITLNELKVANKLKERYHIFFIKLNDKSKQIRGYIINNPMDTFDINLSDLSPLLKLQNISIVPNRFVIELNEKYFEELNVIDMTYLIDRIETDI